MFFSHFKKSAQLLLLLLVLLELTIAQAKLMYLSDPTNASSVMIDEHLLVNEAVYLGPLHVLENGQVTIRCVLSLFQLPIWSLNGRLLDLRAKQTSGQPKYSLTIHKNVALNSHSQTLTINAFQFDDSGEYKCTQFGTRTHALHVLIQNWAQFARATLYHINFQLLYAGEQTLLVCDLELQNKGREALLTLDAFEDDETATNDGDSDESSITEGSGWGSKTEADAAASEIRWTRWAWPLNELRTKSRVLVNRSGQYACHLGDQQQVFQIFEPATIESKVHKLHANPGATIELECKPGGYPRPSVQWFIGNSKVDPRLERFSNAELVQSADGYANAILRVQNVSSDDSAIYTCNAVSQVELQRFEAEDSIQVAISEEVISANGTSPLELHRTTQVRCKMLSQDHRITKWQFQGKDILGKHKKYNVTENGQVLHIFKSELEDEGKYRCIASNGQSRQVLVIARPKLRIEEAGETRINYRSVYAFKGGELSLLCTPASRPAEHVLSWTYEGKVLDGSRVRRTPHGLWLNVSGLSIAHVGWYACNGSNPVGQDINKLRLRLVDPYSYIWPVCGIVIQLLLLFSCICCCPEKKKRRQHAE